MNIICEIPITSLAAKQFTVQLISYRRQMVDLRLAVRKPCCRYKMATKYQLEPSAMALQSRYGENFVFSEMYDING